MDAEKPCAPSSAKLQGYEPEAISICIIDYKKAFDCVKYKSMKKILEDDGISPYIKKLENQLYWNQMATIRWEGEE